MFEGQEVSRKRRNIHFDEVGRHYHLITKLTSAMVKEYVCKGCSKACKRDVAHVCDQTCSDCMVSPPCAFAEVRIPCDDCHRHFRNAACFANHKLRTSNRKSVCERKRCCETCGWLVTGEKQDCYKRFFETSNENKEIGHLYYMRTMKYALPPAGDNIFTSYTFSRRAEIPSTQTRLSYTYPNSSACSSFVLDARTRKTHEIPCDFVRGGSRSRKILWGNYFHT